MLVNTGLDNWADAIRCKNGKLRPIKKKGGHLICPTCRQEVYGFKKCESCGQQLKY